MMQVRLLYFAWVREAVGVDGETVDVPSGVATPADLIDWLATRGDGYAAAFADPAKVRCAVDQVMVAGVITAQYHARVIRRHPRRRSGAPTRVAIGERGTNLTSPTDSSGAFQFCGIPFDSEVTLLARVPSRLAVTRLIEAGSTALVELEVPIP